MDALALGGIAAALGATLLALHEARRGRGARAALWLAVAALALRVPAAWHFWLSPWDERYHALVAVHALEQPLVPRLVAEPLAPPAPDDWRHAHVWLHKPPLTTWLMAGSLALFGVNEVALRLPSLLAAALGVLATCALGRRFVSERAALAAGAFQAWHGQGILLAAGLRATDHVDALFGCAVGLGVLQALRAGEALAARRARAWLEVAAVGALTGAALLVKETPALVVPAVFFVALLGHELSWRVRLAAPALALGLALALAAPWQLYTASAFPELAAFARARGARYFLNVVDRRGGPWYLHLANLVTNFGPVAPLALAWFGASALRRGRALAPLLAWFALVYGAFTLAATKMDAYVYIAAPAVFVALGGFALDAAPAGGRRALRALHGLVAVALALGFAVGAWRALDPLEPRPRDALWARELRALGGAVAKLPPGKRVVFGAPGAVECMFYVDATCVAGRASDADVARARAAGFDVIEYGGAERPGVRALPLDPRTLDARALARELRARGLSRPLVFGARDAVDLGAYLKRFVRHTVVSAELPRPGRRLARKLAGGGALVVLVQPGEALPDAVRAAFPQAVALPSARYAHAPAAHAPE